MQTIICMKWGTRYGPEFANRLSSMVRRQTNRPTRLLCFTDDSKGLDEGIEVHPLPLVSIPPPHDVDGWRKLSIWRTPLAKMSGDVLFLDLDLVITGDLDAFFDYCPGKYCVIENWTQKGQGIGNTSVFRFPVGKYPHVHDDFFADPATIIKAYGIEQKYISAAIADQVFWPEEWCISFKHTLVPPWPLNFFRRPPLPKTARVIAFTGKPDPDEAAIGHWPAPWHKKIYKHIRPSPWIDEHWR